MTLLVPWALWFSAIGAAVVALYVLKIKRRRQTVPALEFWRELAGRTKVHSLFQRLKRLLSMLLWLVIAACLILALGNPILSFGKIKPRAIAVIIDNSASMQTIEGESDDARTTRLALAREALGELTTRRPVSDEWLLIEAGLEPRVLLPWTYDGKAVRAAAEQITPFAGSSDVDAAIALAEQLLAGKAEPAIVVISDGIKASRHQGTEQREPRSEASEDPLDASMPHASMPSSPPELIHWPVGTTRDNLGITRLAARLNRQESNYHVLVTVLNASDEPIETQLTFEIDGSAVSVELLDVEPASSWEKIVVLEAPADDGGMARGGVLRVTIDRADALALDNEAYAILQPVRPAVVWLVSPMNEAFFFEQALGAMDDLVWAEESLTLTLDQYDRVVEAMGASGQGIEQRGQEERQEASRHQGIEQREQRSEASEVPLDASMPLASMPPLPDLIIFNNGAPKQLPKGGRFVMINDWPGDVAAAVDAERPLEAPQLFMTPRPHALTRYITLHGARLAKARRVTLNEPADVLAQTAEGDPLIFLVEHLDRKAICLAFDVFDSDLPFRNAFPLLLRNAVSFLHAEAPSWTLPEYKIGQTIHPLRRLPADIATIEVTAQRGEDMTTAQLPVHDGHFAVGDTASAGALRVSFGEDVSFTAINLTDAEESRITPSEAITDPREQLVLSGRLFGTMPWIGFAFAAAALVALEWLTYNFRWTE